MRALTLLMLASCTTHTSTAIGDTSVVVGGASDDGSTFVDWHSGLFAPPIVSGPQGGQHIWVSVRTGRGFDAKDMRLTIDMTDLDTGAIVKPGTIPVTATLTDTGDALQVVGLRGYVKEPCVIQNHHVHVRVGVDDRGGQTGSDEVDIRPTWSGYCDP